MRSVDWRHLSRYTGVRLTAVQNKAQHLLVMSRNFVLKFAILGFTDNIRTLCTSLLQPYHLAFEIPSDVYLAVTLRISTL